MSTNKPNFSLNELLETLKTQSARDLAWALFSPELITHHDKNFAIKATSQRIQWLKEIDSDDLSLPSQSRLGHYYEALWVYFFQHDEQYKYIAHNVQIHQDGKTLGELDFIIFDDFQQRYIHLEVAIKFYMYYAESNEASTDKQHWIGPNSQDNLDKKWQHLNNEQTSLTSKNACKTHLESLGIKEKPQTAFSLKGYLFQQENVDIKPVGLAPNNIIHTYYKNSDFIKKRFNDCYLSIIPKQQWLMTYHNKESIRQHSQTEISEMVNLFNTPIMAGIMTTNNQFIEERQRFFVTPDNWPHHLVHF
jgi:hypothetical protein